ncbi:MAG: N,N-dimethylformamidase beta subunit family domain-containing protein [Mycobacteriales bacterium]
MSDARAAGTNIAFLGANAIYRHIRLTGTPLGPNRLQIDYKSSAGHDPVCHRDPAAATFDWPDGPDPRPESTLTGGYYQCNGVQADMITADPNSWLLARTALTRGARLLGLIGNEYDRVDLSVPTPRPIEILFHSPLSCAGRRDYSDVSYYTTQSGAGVFDAGTSAWICALGFLGRCAPGVPDGTAHDAITTITTNLLDAISRGPAGRMHPAHDNVGTLYPRRR